MSDREVLLAVRKALRQGDARRAAELIDLHFKRQEAALVARLKWALNDRRFLTITDPRGPPRPGVP